MGIWVYFGLVMEYRLVMGYCLVMRCGYEVWLCLVWFQCEVRLWVWVRRFRVWYGLAIIRLGRCGLVMGLDKSF